MFHCTEDSLRIGIKALERHCADHPEDNEAAADLHQFLIKQVAAHRNHRRAMLQDQRACRTPVSRATHFLRELPGEVHDHVSSPRAVWHVQ